MKRIDTHPHVLTPIKVDVTSQDLLQQVKTSGHRPGMVKTAQRTLDKVRDLWRPAAVCRWVEFQQTDADTLGVLVPDSGSPCRIDFGFSIQFLRQASHALVSVYTAGQELEQASMDASSRGDLLEAYFIDIIGLIVLDRAGQAVKEIAEKQARDSGWGVSPFLSPGSVHGWDLEGQIPLCSLLPLEKINVTLRKDAVLSPFKTVSCLIGLGPGYDAVRVGTTCEVCSKNRDCQMKQNETTEVRKPSVG